MLKALILPPGGNLLLMATGVAFRRRWPRVARGLTFVGAGSLALCAFPLFALLLSQPLERIAPLAVEADGRSAEAVVILGGGRRAGAPEYAGRDTVHTRVLERLRYGARVARQLGLPIALCGGALHADEIPEALLMASVLHEDFGLTARWLETSSRNTAENALRLREAVGLRRIVLVTHALHMRRAAHAFAQAGFEVLPAPVAYVGVFSAEDLSIFDFIPSVEALHVTRDALHEYLGLLWYRARYRA